MKLLSRTTSRGERPNQLKSDFLSIGFSKYALAGLAGVFAAAAATSYGSLFTGGYGIEHQGTDSQGNNIWVLTYTNTSLAVNENFATDQLDIGGALAVGSTPITDKQWDLLSSTTNNPNPYDNGFSVDTSNPDNYIYPSGFDDPSITTMKTTFKTLPGYNQLVSGSITAHSVGGEEKLIYGLVVTQLTPVTDLKINAKEGYLEIPSVDNRYFLTIYSCTNLPENVWNVYTNATEGAMKDIQGTNGVMRIPLDFANQPQFFKGEKK